MRLNEILDSDFISAIEDVTYAVNDLEEYYISDLTEFYNNDNINEETKNNVVRLIKSVNSLRENLCTIEEIYEWTENVAKKDDNYENFKKNS